jgi:hypothetical protein
VNYFADFLQNQAPAALHAAVLARRAKLEKKHGKAMTFAADLIGLRDCGGAEHATLPSAIEVTNIRPELRKTR